MNIPHILEYFKRIVHRFPENPAIILNGVPVYTYKQLYQASCAVAHILIAHGIKKGDIVAIGFEKSPEYIIVLLGTWFSGAAFMPLPPSLPRDRKAFMVKDARPACIIGGAQALYESTGEYIPSIDIQRVLSSVKNPVRCPSIQWHTDDVAYVMYTSGSTGTPKGVVVTHEGIVPVLISQIKTFKLKPESRSLFFLSINFDASLSDIGTVLLSGAALCIEEKEKLELAASLPAILSQREITHIDIPPSLLEILDIQKIPSSLKTIVIGGEPCSIETVKKWAKKFRLINVYGPTETTICSSMVVCSPHTWDGPDIGIPMAHIRYRVMTPSGREILRDGMGELYIGGKGLARGYMNRDVLTKEKFVPFQGKRWYRTGDLVKRKGKKLYFIGRTDRQVKIRGQLASLEEIELQLKAHPDIARAAVIVHMQGTIKQLTAFIQSHGKIPNEYSIKNFLRHGVPFFMIPQRYIMLSQFPVGLAGKVDYTALSEMLKNTRSTSREIASNDMVMNALRSAWEQVLGRKSVGFDDDFFSLGGDSLSVLQIVTEAEKVGIIIPIGIMREAFTIRKLASWYKKHATQIISDGMPARLLEKDAQITPSWKRLLRNAASLPLSEHKSIFITGATGFLGSHVLKEIFTLQEKSLRKVFVLVRASNVLDARRIMFEAAKKQGVTFKKNEIEHIVPLCGDVTKKQFGLGNKDWVFLSREVSDVYHCAAIVNMVEPYETLKKANVDGTKEIIRFALTHTRKTIHYASTLSVFVATDRNKGVVRESDDLSRTRIVYGGYAQSKWVAERFLHQIPKNILPVNIFRFGLITGDSKTGISSSHDYVSMFICGLMKLGSVPKGDYDSLILDVTPIDYTAKVFAYIAKKSKGGTYHIANTKGFTLDMLIRALKKRGSIIKSMSGEEWYAMIRARTLGIAEAAAFTALARLVPYKGAFEQLRSMDLFQATDITFDQRHTRQFLRDILLSIPKADSRLLEKYLSHISCRI